MKPVPVNQQAQFKEINKMLQLVVIKPVNHATPWISSFIIVEMNKDTKTKITMKDPHPKSKIHICLDPSNLNKATIPESYYYWMVDDVMP